MRGRRIPLEDRSRQFLGLLEADVGWQRRHLRVGDELDQRRAASGQRLIPRLPDLLRTLDPGSMQPEHPCVPGIVEVRQHLGGVKLGIA